MFELNNRKKTCRFHLIWLLILMLGTVGCKDTKESAEKPGPQQPLGHVEVEKTDDAGEKTDNSQIIGIICAKMLTGDFLGAGEIIEKVGHTADEQLIQLQMLIDEYERVTAARKTVQTDAYQEQIDKLEKLRDQDPPQDANDISKAFSIIVKAAKHADEEQKKALLQDPFVTKLTETAIEKARQFELRADWVQAYTHCYYWLSRLDKDNDEYKERAKLLTDKASIELSHKNDSCETCDQRYQGVRPQIFVWAVKLLDLNYGDIVD